LPEFDLVIPTAFLTGLLLFARRAQGSWFAPGAFFALVWAIQVLLSFVFPEFTVWSGSIWWIVLTTLVLFLGSEAGGVFAGTMRGRGQGGPASNSVVFRRSVGTMVVCFLGGMGYTILAQLGFFSVAFGDWPPLMYQLLLPFNFAGPMLGGMIFASGSLQGRRAWLTILPLLPPAGLAILFGGRTAIVAPILFWLAGYFSIQILLTRGKVSLFTATHILGVAAIVFMFLLIGEGLYIFRTLNLSGEDIGVKLAGYQHDVLRWESFVKEWPRFRSAVFGNVYSFSFYFAQAWENPPSPHWGSIIFAAPLHLLGLGGERYPFEVFEIEPGVFSNIYTMLRLPMDDFGLWGSLVWWLAIGVVQGWAYARVRHGSVLPCTVLAWFYVDTVIIGGLFFRYNSIILAYVIVALYLLRFVRLPTRRSARIVPLEQTTLTTNVCRPRDAKAEEA
jgi:hypothetical protein